MSGIKLAGIVLIAAGILGLAYQGFSYTKETHEAKMGHRDELDWRGREWRKRVATLPDSHAESGSASLTDSGADRALIFAATFALAAVAIPLAANSRQQGI